MWQAGEQSLYWVDIPARKLCRWRASDGNVTIWMAAEMLACIAPGATPGTWVAGMETGVFRLQPQSDGQLESERLSSVAHGHAGMRFNDGRCDRQGRFWAGTMVSNMSLAAAAGAMYRYDQPNGLQKMLDGFITPNGLAFSPDGKTMYLSDSHPTVQLIWAFDYDTASGTPSNRRVFVDMNQHPGRPDGAAVDEDGCYWSCANDAGQLLRFTPAGKLDRAIPLPVKKPSMCAFGGSNLDTLFVTSIRPEGIDLSDQPLAGAVFALHPGIKGLSEPELGTLQ